MAGIQVILGAVALVTALTGGGPAAACGYISFLAEDPIEAARLRQEIEVVREVSDDPVLYNKQGIDTFSQTCLACHAGSIQAGWGIGSTHAGGTTRGAHRIGINYVSVAARGKPIRNAGALDRRLVLVEGRIACISCHDPFNPEGNHLTIENNGSALCLSCHMK